MVANWVVVYALGTGTSVQIGPHILSSNTTYITGTPASGTVFDSTGNLSLYPGSQLLTTTNTLPATIKNDGLGGVNINTNGNPGAFNFSNGGTLVLGVATGCLYFNGGAGETLCQNAANTQLRSTQPLQLAEVAAPVAAASNGILYEDSASHLPKWSANGAAFNFLDQTSNTTTTTTQVLHGSATAGTGTYSAIVTADEPSSVVQNNQVNTGGASMTLNMTSSGAITPSQTNGIVGTTTNNNVNAGGVGEYVQSVLATGSSVTLATGVTSNVTSISLTAGDWDVTGAVDFTFGATTSYTNLIGSVSSTSATIGAQDSKFDFETPAAVPTAGADATFPVPVVRFSLSGTTTVFLVAQGTFTVSTLKAYGTIRARRVR